MHPLEATWTAEHVEHLLASDGDLVRATCHAVPLRPGADRRRARWCYVIWTDASERTVRETLVGFTVEHHGSKAGRSVYVAWPAR